MIWVRRLILIFPIALLAFFGVAFFSVRIKPPKKLNQLTIGSAGEAKILNPILYTTSSDGEVCDLVFRGLINYNEDIEIIGDLATSWEITQTSTLFYPSAADAAMALQTIQSATDQWPAWNITAVNVSGTRILVQLSEAGTSFQEPLLKQLGDRQPLPVSFVRVHLTATKETVRPAELMKRIETEIATQPDLAGRYHSHFVNTSADFDLVLAGETDSLMALVKTLLPAAEVAVAETFPILNEPEIVFEMRRDARWHDGQPVTARDVAFTYQAIMDENVASPRRPDYELIRHLDVVDDDTVRVVYRKPYAPSLLSWGMGILPRHILEGHDTKWWAEHFNRQPIGCGPFKFDEWRSNQYIKLVRNPDFYEGAPHLESVLFRSVPDMVALRLLFETGEIDFWGVPPHATAAFTGNQRFDVFAREAPQYEYIGWNLRRPIFQDVRVRRALAHAVNVKAMIEFVYYGRGVQSTGPFPPQMWFANPDIQPYEYNPAKAKALLAEAGWKPGPDGILQKDGQRFTFTLITNHPNEVRKDIATLAQSDLEKIGIEVDVQLYEWAVFVATYINKLDFDACVLGWSLGYDYDQYQIWHSSQAKPDMLNHVSYANPKADRLIELARSEFDKDKAKEYLWEFNRIIYEDQPYLFLVVPQSVGAMHPEELRVKRPAPGGGWVEEQIRSTKRGFRVYQDWWYRPVMTP